MLRCERLALPLQDALQLGDALLQAGAGGPVGPRREQAGRPRAVNAHKAGPKAPHAPPCRPSRAPALQGAEQRAAEGQGPLGSMLHDAKGQLGPAVAP